MKNVTVLQSWPSRPSWTEITCAGSCQAELCPDERAGRHNRLLLCQSPLQDISSPPDPRRHSAKSPTNEPCCYKGVWKVPPLSQQSSQLPVSRWKGEAAHRKTKTALRSMARGKSLKRCLSVCVLSEEQASCIPNQLFKKLLYCELL